MKLTILGSGSGVITAKRSSSGYLVSINDKVLLLDSGPGTLKRIVESSYGFEEIDYAIYTHFHPDHIVDLISLLFVLRNSDHNNNKKLVIIGPQGIKNLYQNLAKSFFNFIRPKDYSLVIEEMASDSYIDYDDFRIKSGCVKHLEHSIAYRIESQDGKGLVYSGDTDYCEGIAKLAKEADLLLLECSHPKHMKVDGHLNACLAGQIARESDCKKLVLTHFYPICDDYDILGQCKEEYKGEIVLAEDLMVINV